MNIVINALSARLGGGQTYLYNLLRESEKREGLKIFLVAPESFRFLASKNICRIQPGWPTDNILVRMIWEKVHLYRILERIGGGLFFCPGGLLSPIPPPGYKIVTIFRNMIPFEPAIRAKYPLLGRQRIRNRLLENALLKGMILSDLVIFISEFARQAILNRVPEGIRKSVVIPHGISEPFRISPDRPPTRPDWARNHEYLLYVSILDVYKNQIEVLQGYHRLKQIRKTNEKLVFVGHHATPYGRKVKKEIARLGLGGDVILTGNLPYLELPKAYFHAKMNIFASGCENCPNILLEALGAGRPLIVSNRPPMPEIGGGSLLYFDPFSPDDFTSKVATVIDDPIHLQRLSAESRERSHRYNWAETARLTWNALQRLEGEK